MDGRRFDALVRLLGGAITRRAAVAALASFAAGKAAPGVGAKKGKCRKDSPTGQCCRKNGTCICRNGGIPCGAHCCAVGQVCKGGSCLVEPPPCSALGQSCKNVRSGCCDGLVCGSGQGGWDDVACYAPAGAPCMSAKDCVYGSSCEGGFCISRVQPGPDEDPEPEPTPEPCRGTIPVTGDPATDGEALRALAEDPAGPATIVLCAGIYRASQEIAVTRNLAIAAAKNAGGKVILDGGWSGDAATDGHRVIWVTGSDVSLTGITVRNGYNGGDGGCISVNATAAAAGLTLTRVLVSTCKSQNGGGGGIFIDGTSSSATLTLDASEISDCTCPSGPGSGNGGGIRAVEASVTLSNALVADNEAGWDGGGIHVKNSVSPQRRLDIADSTISGNRSSQGGGGFYSWATAVTLSGGTVVGGLAAEDGNTAGEGGGFYAYGGPVTLKDRTRITNNESNYGGGGGFHATNSLQVYMQGTATVDGNRSPATHVDKAGYELYGSLECSGTPKVCANPDNTASGCWGGFGSTCVSPALCSATC